MKEIKKEKGCKDAKYSFASKKYRYEIELADSVEVDDDEFVCTSKV